MAAPSAMMSALISLEESILSSRARSTFKIFPRSGKIAWKRRSLACLAEPPAESPSTMKISDSSGRRDWQSANFPGRVSPSKMPFLKTVSFAALAALRASSAKITFSKIRRASEGFSSRKAERASPNTVSTAERASGVPSFALVCPSNCGSFNFTAITAVSPSCTSSPVSESFSFKYPFLRA